MRILTSDEYIVCDELIKESNNLYNKVKERKMHKDDIEYIQSMNRYINHYERFKEKQIKQYIEDLQEYINFKE